MVNKLNIINAWNDHICMNVSKENNSAAYTEIAKDLKTFKELT